MFQKPILNRVSYKSATKPNAASVFSEGSPIFEQALFTKAKEERESGDLLYEITESKLDFSHIIKTSDLKRELDLLVKERKNFSAVKKHNLPLSNKILLHGTPGCGKTLTAYCLAGELKKPLYIVSLGNIVSSKLGETAQNLERIFRRAKEDSAILFLDEFDILSRDRGSSNDHGEIKRVVNVILQILDLLDEETIFIAATNQFSALDRAIVRRFNYIIEYLPPNAEKVHEYLGFLQDSYQFSFTSPKLKKDLAKIFENESYADIKNTMIALLKTKIFGRKNAMRGGRIKLASKDITHLLNKKESKETSL